ncbi:Sugar/inositol transporter [Metarhizium rileyi]|uniref:Sugar/inositol transporter n=1 Tax=Metarhizium rileyi (strain RCEF 4871) TaxID=1649241 RepID=A0A162LSZ8_METRR|nr:Sugar/inositol transporter [Metarhizium rileyi RCEF 4871]
MPAATADALAVTKDTEAYEVEHNDLRAGDAGPSRVLGIDQTRDITEAEHELGFWRAVQMYPQATFWSMFFCLAVVMAGFDAQIITSFYALPAFQRKYGDRVGDHYEVAAPWQTGLGMGNPIGQAVGALASSYPLHYLGRRKTLGLCCIWSIGFVFVQFFATSIGMLCAGEVLGGLAYGFYVVIAPTYASETCPVTLRGFLTTSVNLAFVIGQFIAQGCAAGVETRLDEWAYKIPFAIQWVWPVVLLAGLPFAPESPYWLVRRGRREDARQSLLKLTSSKHRPDVDKLLNGIEQTDLLEREYETETTYSDCFKGVSLVRTEISVMVYLIQVIGGNPLIGYANYFFEQAGLSSSDAFSMGVGNTALGFVGTVISWPLMNFFNLGRRTIYTSGMVVMTILLFVIGFLSIPKNNTGAIWAMASLMDTWTFVYQMTVGPICFVVISEISATRLRERTIAIATAVQACASIVFTVAMPYMLNSNEANWGGKAGFLFGAISAVCLVWCYFRLPESRNRTYEELDILFQRRIPARQFEDYDLLAETDAVHGSTGRL